MAKRNTVISICKALAIILMVMGHTEGPGGVIHFIYLFHMPVFFICAGYFFSTKYLQEPWRFVEKRFKGLYVPFLKWALFFLVIHNLMFSIGILNEQFGNWENGVTHPYGVRVFLQRLFNIVFAMGGYDEFLAGAFWFFRALLITSLVFLAAYLLLYNRHRRLTHTVTTATIAAVALAVAWVKIYYGLTIPNVVQGGIRECWGVFFFAFGWFYRLHEQRFREHWLLTLGYAALLVAACFFPTHGMILNPKPYDVATLPVTGVAGFLMLHHVSRWLDGHDGPVKRFLTFCGDNTLSIFVFHVCAFKIVSAVKVWYYGLPWGMIGCHMVVHEHAATDAFFLLYTLVGVAVPLLWISGYRRLKVSWTAKGAKS